MRVREMSGESFAEKLLFLLLPCAVRAVLLRRTVTGEAPAPAWAALARPMVLWQFCHDVFEGQKASLRWRRLPAPTSPRCFVARRGRAMRPPGTFPHPSHLPDDDSGERRRGWLGPLGQRGERKIY